MQGEEVDSRSFSASCPVRSQRISRHIYLLDVAGLRRKKSHDKMFTIESILGTTSTSESCPTQRGRAAEEERRVGEVQRAAPAEIRARPPVSPFRAGDKRKSLSDTEEETDRDSLAGDITGTTLQNKRFCD